MAEAVWKYPVPVGDLVQHAMPEGARLSLVEVSPAEPGTVLTWWVVDPSTQERTTRQFTAIGTGQEVYGRGTVLGSALHRETGLVWHLVEAFPKEG